jgi:hypothetical protein
VTAKGSINDTTARAQIHSIITTFMPAASITLTSAIRSRQHDTKDRFIITVSSLEDADAMVRHRCGLKGSPHTIFDVLSPEEDILQKALWPQFLKARAAGHRAQFTRASLKIDGIRV